MDTDSLALKDALLDADSLTLSNALALCDALVDTDSLTL